MKNKIKLKIDQLVLYQAQALDIGDRTYIILLFLFK